MHYKDTRDNQCLCPAVRRVEVPNEMITDQAMHFISGTIKELQKELGIKGRRKTPNYPKTDGLIASVNQTLKQMLLKLVSDTSHDCDKWLPFVLFVYR